MLAFGKGNVKCRLLGDSVVYFTPYRQAVRYKPFKTRLIVCKIRLMTSPAQPKIKYLVLSAVFLIAAYNLTRTTIEILQSSKRLDDLKDEVSMLESKKDLLKQEVSYKQTDDYIEEQARNALNLVKPGEKVYVVPQVLGKNTASNDNKTETTKIASGEPTDNKSNMQLWIELFL